MPEIEQLQTDVLVLGGGLAGYRAAHAARQCGVSVTIASRARGASPYVIGFNAPLGHADARDTPEVYFDDMVRGGYGLNDRRLVHVLANQATAAYHSLAALGIPFALASERSADGRRKTLQRHLSGNTYPRSVYIPAGTGRTILEALIAKTRDADVRTIAGHRVVQLLHNEDAVTGALLWKPHSQTLVAIQARAVVLAMGGIGQLYADTTYPADVNAGSFGLALDAGACLIDMEFVQFEPVVTVWPAACRGMEMPTAMLGDGAHLRNALGERFMLRYNPPLGERGIEKAKMALCIQQEIDAGNAFPEGGVLFDTTLLSPEQLESYVAHCKRLRAAGVDPARQAPQVAPAAHSIMGGVLINENCWSGVPGLYVCGEATGGVHGASRLAGNGCSDTLVFGDVAGRAAANGMRQVTHPLDIRLEATAMCGSKSPRTARCGLTRPVIARIRSSLAQAAGIWRSAASMQTGLAQLDRIDAQLEEMASTGIAEAVALIDARHMARTARIILRAALKRTESRGAHQRTDFPERDDQNWLRHIGFRHGESGQLIEEVIPIQ